MNQFQEWFKLYAAAMLESDPAQLPQRIDRAYLAIRARLQLPGTPPAEQTQLESALNYLSRLNA